MTALPEDANICSCLSEATILHADLDAFYASVEQRDDPRLRGRPVIVGGGRRARRELRGEGVRRAHGDGRAPGAPAVPAGDRRRAAHVGVLRGEQGGVRGVRRHDAARRGAVDRRGVPRRRRAASGRRARRVEIAVRLRRDVLERVGLPITVGVARTKFLAKVASGVAKPDGLLVVPPDRELAFLHPLPVERLWGVGRGDRREAARAGASRRSARWRGSTRRCSSSMLGRASGRHLHALAHNRDPRPVQHAPPPRLDRIAARARPRGRDRPATIDAVLVGARRPRHAPDARGRAGSAAPSCCACASTTSRARPARTRSPQATAQTETILDAARALLAAAMPLIERAGPHARRRRGRQPRRRRRRAARAAVRRGAAARSTPRSTRCATGSDRRRSRARVLLGRDPGLTMPLLPD